MAETINSQGVGVDFSGLQTASPNPTTGTEGRTQKRGIDFSGAQRVLEGAVEGISGIAIEQEEGREEDRKARVMGQFAYSDQDLTHDFLSGASNEELALDALGISGSGYTPEEVAEMSDFQNLVGKLDQAEKAGTPEVRLSLLRTRLRQRYTTRNPSLTEEFLNISGKVDTLSASARSAAREGEEAARERQRKAKDTLYEAAVGMVGPQAVLNAEAAGNTAQIREWGTLFGEVQRKGEMLAIRLQNAQNREDLTQIERDRLVRKEMQDGGIETTVASVTSEAMAIAGSNQTVEQKTFQLTNLLTTRRAEIMKSLRLTTEAEFDEMFGNTWTSIQDMAEGIASGETGATEAKNRVSLVRNAALLEKKGLVRSAELLNLIPSEVHGLLLNGENSLFDTYSDIMGNIAKQIEGNNPPPTGGGGEGGGAAGGNQGGRNTGGSDSSAVNPAQSTEIPSLTQDGEELTPEQVKDRADRLNQIIQANRRARAESGGVQRESATSVSGVRTEGVPIQLNGLTALTILADTSASDTLAGVKSTVPSTADPQFLEEVADLDVPQQAIDSVGRMAFNAAKSARVALNEEAESGNLSVTLGEDGLFRFSLNEKTGNSTKIKRFERLWNDSVKSFAHLNKDDNYAQVSQTLWNDTTLEMEIGD